MNNNHLNILIVDDDDVARESFLRAAGKAKLALTVTEAQDGLEAYEILKERYPKKKVKQPVVVLLDLNMPRMSGFEFLQTIRADKALRSTIVFMLTTSDLAEDKKAALAFNVAGYMAKANVGPGYKNLLKLIVNYDTSGNI